MSLLEASTYAALAPSQSKPSGGQGAAKPKRIRDHKRTLTMVDKRTVTWRRIVELRKLFTDALTSAGLELSPVRALKIEQAAQAMAVAELARGRFMRDGTRDLDELVRAERRADAAVRAVGLPKERSGPLPPSIHEIAARYQAKAP